MDQYCRTRALLDIQGNDHEVQDALGRAVMRYGYTMLSRPVAHIGMDTGGGLVLPDVTGSPVYARNSRGFAFRTSYDALRRPVSSHVAGPGITGEALQARTEYGESLPGGEARNLRARIVRLYDGAGLTVNEAYDFKGNLLHARRQLAAVYREVVDWASEVPLEGQQYHSRTSYDALNRPTSMTSPDSSVLIPSYDPASLLERIDGRLRGAAEVTTFIEHIDYNARGQRTRVCHGNGSVCVYSYDRLTFRLTSVITLRGHRRLQDLRYTYDPIGNPTLIRDYAQRRAFFRNHVAGPSAAYRYDALYRLIEATGREHIGQAAPEGRRTRSVPPGATDAPRVGLPQPGDGAAMARYVERYAYDEVGNLRRMAHRSADKAHGGWTRDYRYREPSLLEPERRSNRLTAAGPARDVTSPQHFSYDQQGNITAMPQIPVLRWDQDDRLHATCRQVAQRGVPSTTYYTYDVAGQRVRKVTERAAKGGKTTRRSERIYVGACEVYREYGTDGAITLERETLHVFGDMHRIALVETRTVGTDHGPGELIRYQFTNHLDSSVLELDQAGRVISYEEYYPYGGTSYQAVRTGTETPKRYRYTGKERDTETGLYYHGARYYAPWLARWTSADTAGLADGTNLYAYVRCNPVRLRDPTGHYSWSDFGSDIWSGVKGAAKGIAEPVLIVADFGQMGAALVTKEWFPSYYHDVKWLSATGQHFEQSPNEGLGTRLVHTVVEPELNLVTGGGYGLANNINTAIATGDPEKARHILVQGAAGQIAATGFAVAADRIGGEDTASREQQGSPPETSSPSRNTTRTGAPDEAPVRTTGDDAQTTSNARTRAKADEETGNGSVARAPKAPAGGLWGSVVIRLAKALERQNERLATAIRMKDTAFLRNLGLRPRTIAILLRRSGRTYAAAYGRAIEAAFARAIRSDPELNALFEHIGSRSGIAVRRPGRPDFRGRPGTEFQGLLVDVTTWAARAAHYARYYGEKMLVLGYHRR